MSISEMRGRSPMRANISIMLNLAVVMPRFMRGIQ